MLEAKETHNEPGRTEDVLKTINTFDHRGRLLQSRVKLNNSDEMVVKETYNPLGQVVKRQFGPGAEQYLNFFPITYNIQGWVTSYGNTNFRYKLKYFDPTIAEPSYTGNVTQAIFAHAMAAYQNIGYTYDKLNRLKTANFYRYPDDITPNRETQYEETDFVYDLNGNITSLKRAGQPITMNYNGNQLAQYNKAGYFEYDANGNTLTTKNTGKDLQFEFNSLNLLDNVKQNGAVKARYIWTADGAKRAVADAARSNGFEYLGSLVYARMNGTMELESANLADGRIAKTSNGYQVQYYYKDHLGSVRFVDGQYGRDDYMPYGSRMQADGYATSSSRTKFSGKEMQTLSVTTSNGALAQLGLYDFGARMYDPTLCRWLTNDPLAEKYYPMSPYLYCAGNPIRYVDPNGMDIYRFDDESGEMILHQETDDDFDQVGNFKRVRNKETKTYSYELITNKKGEAKMRIDNIEKGILSDGMNMQDKANVIEVGGEGQASVAGFENFIVQFSDMIGKEMAGHYYSKLGETNISYVHIGMYIGNISTRSYAAPNIFSARVDLYGKVTPQTHWHTHPTYGYDLKDRITDSEQDKIFKMGSLKSGVKNFIILTGGYPPIRY